jgi:hypothetical protein
MLGTDIALKYHVASIRYDEMLREAARERAAAEAVAAAPRARGTALSDVRTAIASALLRAGSWLMPDDGCGLELRPGR